MTRDKHVGNAGVAEKKTPDRMEPQPAELPAVIEGAEQELSDEEMSAKAKLRIREKHMEEFIDAASYRDEESLLDALATEGLYLTMTDIHELKREIFREKAAACEERLRKIDELGREYKEARKLPTAVAEGELSLERSALNLGYGPSGYPSESLIRREAQYDVLRAKNAEVAAKQKRWAELKEQKSLFDRFNEAGRQRLAEIEKLETELKPLGLAISRDVQKEAEEKAAIDKIRQPIREYEAAITSLEDRLSKLKASPDYKLDAAKIADAERLLKAAVRELEETDGADLMQLYAYLDDFGLSEDEIQHSYIVRGKTPEQLYPSEEHAIRKVLKSYKANEISNIASYEESAAGATE